MVQSSLLSRRVGVLYKYKAPTGLRAWMSHARGWLKTHKLLKAGGGAVHPCSTDQIGISTGSHLSVRQPPMLKSLEGRPKVTHGVAWQPVLTYYLMIAIHVGRDRGTD